MKNYHLFFNTFLCVTMAQHVFAKNMDEVRDMVRSTESGKKIFVETRSEVDASKNATLQKVFGLLNQNPKEFISLSQEMKKAVFKVKKNRHSSYQLKVLMNDGVKGLLKREKLDAPISYDPAWSPKEHLQNLATHQCHAGLSEFLGVDINGVNHESNKLDELLSILISDFISKDDNDQLVQGGETGPLVKQLNSFLKKGPVNVKNQSLLDILGEVKAIEGEDGRFHRLVMSSSKIQVKAGFSMAATLFSGEDEAFVAFQGCLLSYLDLQHLVFASKTGSSSLKQSLGFLAADEQDQMIEQTYRFMLELEGKKNLNSASLLKFVQKRLEILGPVVDFLRQKDAGARAAHQLLSQLSTSQQIYFLSTLLALQIDDMPTAKEQDRLGEAFALIMGNVSTNDLQDLKVSYDFYNLIGKQLRALESLLEEKDKLQEGESHDLEMIRKLKRS